MNERAAVESYLEEGTFWDDRDGKEGSLGFSYR